MTKPVEDPREGGYPSGKVRKLAMKTKESIDGTA
jgi:hypothetical protein